MFIMMACHGHDGMPACVTVTVTVVLSLLQRRSTLGGASHLEEGRGAAGASAST
jgi:hypothetical protein